ncbi:Uma2 family endonuclease [Myceligenerans crystallogenes]|uniref:Uma2 family endonuclease n=1 Tax=Myceligenerans crystallogenes TaxID=316335 RepID=A0ABP4ZCN9_9MICO
MTELPDWMRPPRPEGWLAEDLDHLPNAPRHTELIDGSLILSMSPQRFWHMEVVDSLRAALRPQAPAGHHAYREMTILLDEKNRPEPDVTVSTTPYDGSRTSIPAGDVELVIEVVSPESEQRDKKMKPAKYAEAGIRNMWIVEQEASGDVAVSVYELDDVTTTYTRVQVARDKLTTPVPFPIEIDLTALTP